MSNKRYYWLKLNENFFEDDTIEWIEEQENGERYVLFYLKLCLKSIKDEGNLIRYVGEKLIPYDIKSLAKLTNTDKDTVAVSLKVFEEIGLIERTDAGEIYMKQIDEMIGTETDSARRVRKHRVRKRQLEESNPQSSLQCNSDVIKSNTEIEIEEELEIDKEVDAEEASSDDFMELAKAFEENGFGTISSYTRDSLSQLSEEYTREWVLDAIRLAVDRNARNLRYVEGILKSWYTNGKDDNTSKGQEKSTNSWAVDAT